MKRLGFLWVLILIMGIGLPIFQGEKEVAEISDIEKYRNLTLTNRDKKEGKIYVVEKGDSINKIAAIHKILPWQLRQANAMEAEDSILHPGQKLFIPVVSWKSYVGCASWYGPGFHGKKMANGQIYNQNKILIAHRTLPLGLKVRITNLENSKSIVAYVLDRGPYTKKNGKYDREVDLSLGAAKALASVEKGIIPVKIIPLQG